MEGNYPVYRLEAHSRSVQIINVQLLSREPRALVGAGHITTLVSVNMVTSWRVNPNLRAADGRKVRYRGESRIRWVVPRVDQEGLGYRC